MNEDERQQDDLETAEQPEAEETLAPDERSAEGQPAGATPPDPNLEKPSGGGSGQKDEHQGGGK